MNTIIIYPGRFHPFHYGHLKTYNNLVKRFGDKVFIATSNKRVPNTSPFTFREKKRIMMISGIPGNRIIQTAQPYRPVEITNYFDPTTTDIVFAVSKKDSTRFNLKNNTNGYMQAFTNNRTSLTQHGYILLVPVIKFKIGDKTIQSASEIRDLYHKGNSSIRNKILSTIYGNVNGKRLKQLFDCRL